MAVSVFTHVVYDSAMYSFSLIPDEVKVYFPRMRQDEVINERIKSLPEYENVKLFPTEVIIPSFDPVETFTKNFSENSLYKFNIKNCTIQLDDTIIVKELHTRFSYSLSSFANKSGIRLISLTEVDFNNIIPRFPPYSIFKRFVKKETDFFGSATKLSDAYLEEMGVHSYARLFYNVVDVNKFIPPMKRDGGDRILFVGRLEKIKGFDTLMDALNHISKNHDFTLYVVGRGSLYSLLGSAKFKYEYYPLISKEDLIRLYSKCSIFVMPSESKYFHGLLYWSEVFSLATMEAMASGMATITSDSGNLPYINQDKNTVFRGGDAVDLERKISIFLDNEDLVRENGRVNRTFIEKMFDKETIKNKWKAALLK